MQSLNLPDPEKSQKTAGEPQGDAEQTGRSGRRNRESAPDSKPFFSFMHKLWDMLPGGPTVEEAEGLKEERESTRLPAVIPVTLFGRDENGQAFRETTRTVDISKRGARIVTLRSLPADTHVWIENPGAGRISIAKVIRRGKTVEPQEATEICVKVLELLDPEKIWSLESAPNDWERGFEAPTPAQRLEYLLARERLARPEVLSYEAIETEVPEAPAEVSAPPPSAAGTVDTAPPPTPQTAEPAVSAGPEPPLASEDSGTNRAVSPEPHVQFPDEMANGEPAQRVAWNAGENGDSPAPAGSSGKPESPNQVFAMESESREELANEAGAVRRVGESAMDSINAAATEALALLKAGQKKVEADLATHSETHQQRIAEVTTATENLEQVSGSLLEKFQTDLESALQDFQTRGEAQAEEWKKTAETLIEEPLSRLRHQSESAARDAEAARTSIQFAGEQARAQLENALSELESRHAALAEAQDKRMAEFASAAEEMERRAGALVKDFENSLEVARSSFQQRGAADQTDMEKAAQELLDNSKRKLQGHAEATLSGLGENARETLAMTAEEGRKQVAGTKQALETLAHTVRERFEQRLTQKSKEQAEIAGHSSEAAVNTIRLTAERAVSRLEAAKEKIVEGFTTWADVFQTRLGELFAGMEGLERHSESLLRDFRRQLEQAVKEFAEKRTVEMATLERASHQVADRLTQQAEERAETILEKLKEEAAAIVRSVEEESQTHLSSANKALESATRAASELYAHRLARTSAEQNEQAWLAADEVVSSISLGVDESLARIAAAQEKMEARLSELIENHQRRMTEVAAEIQSLEKRSAALLENLQNQHQGSAPVSPQEESLEFPPEKTAGAN